MKTVKQLREERSAISDKITAISATENPTAEQKAELRTLLASEISLNEEIETALELETRNAKIAAVAAGKETQKDPLEKEMRNFSFGKLLNEGNKVTGFEREMIQESEKEAREMGISTSGTYLSNALLSKIISPMFEKRTMTAATGSAGGYLVPTIKLDWFDALFALSALDKMGVTKLGGLSANSDIPGIGTAITTGWANGETGTQTPSDPTMVNRSLTPKLLYGATNISKRLLIQTGGSAEQMVLADIMNGMAQALQAAVINGSGASGQPTGIIGTSGIQSVAMGTNGGSVSFAKVMELYAAVANANANLDKAKFLSNPLVGAKAIQTPIDTGSGFMILPYGGYANGQTGNIAGHEFIATSSVPSNLTKGSSSGVCSALLFGDFSQVVVGQFGGIDLISEDITGARTGYRAITINQYNDVVIKQPSAIGAILDITTA